MGGLNSYKPHQPKTDIYQSMLLFVSLSIIYFTHANIHQRLKVIGGMEMGVKMQQ